jgi:hypothetical protein
MDQWGIADVEIGKQCDHHEISIEKEYVIYDRRNGDCKAI